MAVDYPVVLLPGVMGSRLYFPHSGKSWDPDDSLGMLFDWEILVWYEWVRRALHYSEPACLYDDMEDGWSGVAWKYHGKLLIELKKSRQFPRDHGVHAVGYDWRQGIQKLGIYVAQQLQTIIAASPKKMIDVIGYSMGSLALRAAFLTDGTLKANVRKVIYLCPPAVGAVIMYRRFFTGMIYGPDGGLEDYFFRDILGDSQKKIISIASGLPGPVQLLPTKYYPPPWYDGGTPPYPYSDYRCPPGINPTNIGLSPTVRANLALRIAEQSYFETFMGNPSNTAHPDSYLIYGSKSDTEVGFRSRNPANPVRAAAGDMTVAAVSALQSAVPAGNQYAITDPNLEHALACNHPDVINRIKLLLPA